MNGHQVKIIHDYSQAVKMALHAIAVQKLVRGWLVRKEMEKIRRLKQDILKIESVYRDRLKEIKSNREAASKQKAEFEEELKELGTALDDLAFQVKSLFSERLPANGAGQGKEKSPSKALEQKIQESNKKIKSLTELINGMDEEREKVVGEAT